MSLSVKKKKSPCCHQPDSKKLFYHQHNRLLQGLYSDEHGLHTHYFIIPLVCWVKWQQPSRNNTETTYSETYTFPSQPSHPTGHHTLITPQKAPFALLTIAFCTTASQAPLWSFNSQLRKGEQMKETCVVVSEPCKSSLKICPILYLIELKTHTIVALN